MNKLATVLACEKLTKTFTDANIHVEVLKNLDFTVKAGDLIAVIGASGAGKSTLLHCLGGLDKPTSGSVFLMGSPLLSVSESERCRLRNAHLGFVYQFHHLLPEFDALENVAMPLLIAGKKPQWAREKALEWLNKVGLSHRKQHRIAELSGGERQRVAIARALVNDPQCVLADEPTGNLDEKSAAAVFDLILQLNAEHQTSFVMVTHSRELAHQLQKVYRLEGGQLQQVDALQ